MTLNQAQRKAIIDSLKPAYPNQTWLDRLNAMKDAQLWAIFQRIKHSKGGN